MKSINFKWLLTLFSISLLVGNCRPDDELKIPNADEYFAFRAPNNNFNLATPDSIKYSKVNTEHIFVSYNSSSSIGSYVTFEGAAAPGEYPAKNISIYTFDKHYIPSPNQPLPITIEQFGGPGEHI